MTPRPDDLRAPDENTSLRFKDSSKQCHNIKMFDGIVREMKKVRYALQLKRNLISVSALETLGLIVSIRDGVLKMTRLNGGYEGRPS